MRHLPDTTVYATFGKKISEDQVLLLQSFGVKEVVLLWDADAKADTVRQVDKLKLSFKVGVGDFSKWPKGVDPGDTLKLDRGEELVRTSVEGAISTDTVRYVAWQIGL
jgi:hypothetical protein